MIANRQVATILSVLLGGFVGYLIGFVYEATQIEPFVKLVEQEPDLANQVGDLGFYIFSQQLFKLGLILAGLVVGYLLRRWFQNYLDYYTFKLQLFFRRTPREKIIAGLVGALIGIVFLFLTVVQVVSVLPSLYPQWAKLFAAPLFKFWVYSISGILFIYFFSRTAVELYFPESVRTKLSERHNISPGIPPKILDTSAIIDGRVAEIIKINFLEGVIVIPKGVVQELQAIADSSDPQKRMRGRRGLEILKSLQDDESIPLELYDDSEFEADYPAVDDRVVRVAQELKGMLITTDFNLNRVATIQDVPVLNINDLSNAIKTMVVPGEHIKVRIVREGKQSGQGVGYLDDGTMVVVEHGLPYLGEEVVVRVTSMVQSSKGRIVFAKPEEDYLVTEGEGARAAAGQTEVAPGERDKRGEVSPETAS